MGTSEGAATLRAVVSLAFAAYIGGQFAGGGTSRGAASVIYIVILVVSIVAHETAHAVAGKAVGAQVTGMRLGFGPRLTPAGRWLDLRPVIVAAHVTYVPPRGARRGALLAISSAGLVLHVALMALALALGLDHTWVRELLFANLIAFASNAVPLNGSFTSTTAGPNDGAHILALLRHRGPFLDGADPDWQELVAAYSDGGVGAAQVFLAGLGRADAPVLRTHLAQATLAAGRYADAADLAAGSSTPSAPWTADHLFAEAEALAVLTADSPADPGRVTRAAVAADAAFAALPATTDPAIRAGVTHTLALARLLQGRYLEARDLSVEALAVSVGADRCAVLAVQGLAELALGQRASAQALLHQAMTLGRGPLVGALAARVARTPSVS